MAYPFDCRPACATGRDRATLRGTSSATAATASASVFLLLAVSLSFIPEKPADTTRLLQADQTTAWQLRGTLPPNGIVTAPVQASAPRTGKDA